MAGIYLHIPFCRQACSYCDFHFSTNLSRQAEMVRALLTEAELRKDFFGEGFGEEKTVIETVYFGGGTPSVLTEDEVRELLDGLRALWEVDANAEITLECNPDDLDRAKLEAFKAAGINRLSIGCQSFREKDLQLMRRSHNAQQSIESVRMAREIGFENITIDLIYGIPGTDLGDWKKTVQMALDLEVPHISAYALTVEEKTLLAHQVQKKSVVLPEDEAYADQFFSLIDQLEAADFDHYELSNFARKGFRSRHNSAYWHGVPYLGLGPSAHSFRDTTRSWNHAHNARYLQAIAAGTSATAATETLSPSDQLNEYLMTHLRLAEGISRDVIRRRWQLDFWEKENQTLRNFVHEGWMVQNEKQIFLTRSGKMVSDRIIGELFQV